MTDLLFTNLEPLPSHQHTIQFTQELKFVAHGQQGINVDWLLEQQEIDIIDDE